MRCCLYTWIFTLLRPYCFIILFNLGPLVRAVLDISGARPSVLLVLSAAFCGVAGRGALAAELAHSEKTALHAGPARGLSGVALLRVR